MKLVVKAPSRGREESAPYVLEGQGELFIVIPVSAPRSTPITCNSCGRKVGIDYPGHACFFEE